MYLRAGLVSLALLLASRVLGLVRESVQAAAFGTTALADVVVTLMTLPDLASGILAGGALSYALLPWWARQTLADQEASQRQASQLFLAAGGALGLWIAAMPALWGGWLAPGTGASMEPVLDAALRWSAMAVPLSLVSFVWYTRLQHERDVVGMYGMNLVHTAVVIGAMLVMGWLHLGDAAWTVSGLGAGLLLAFGLRHAFLQWRMHRARAALAGRPGPAPLQPVRGLPTWDVWLWALLATGLPVAVPLLARSLVSNSAPGALASFNYAWKLVELPNLLAIQLVSVLAFPALTRAHAEGRAWTVQLRTAFVLSWTLACAGALGLHIAALPVADLLFGWGRMDRAQVETVAVWASAGAWTLLPQSLMAVCLLLLATTGRLRTAAVVYALTLGGLALAAVHDGQTMMRALCLALALAAAALLLLSGKGVWQALAWREIALPTAVCGVATLAARRLEGSAPWVYLLAGTLAALLLLGASYATSPTLRAALKR